MDLPAKCNCSACKSERQEQLLKEASRLLADFAPNSQSWDNSRLDFIGKIWLEIGKQ